MVFVEGQLLTVNFQLHLRWHSPLHLPVAALHLIEQKIVFWWTDSLIHFPPPSKTNFLTLFSQLIGDKVLSVTSCCIGIVALLSSFLSCCTISWLGQLHKILAFVG
jgi:hypothetical protein